MTDDDARLSGVVLELRDGIDADPIVGQSALPGQYPAGLITTTTDATGYYEFRGLPKGNYSVYQLQPSGFVDGIDTSGTIPAIAINQHEEVDPQIVNALKKDPNFDAIVRISLPPGETSELNNFSEVAIRRDVTIPFDVPLPAPIPPVTPIPRIEVTPDPTVFVPPLELPLRTSSRVLVAWANTWHLSVIDGGLPRGDGRSVSPRGPVWFDESSNFYIQWNDESMDEMMWTMIVDGKTTGVFHFGMAHGTPIAGDFNGDGESEIGVFIGGQWFIDLNGNGLWDADDLWAKLGHEGDLPVTGDWDGDGKDDIGIYGIAWPGDRKAVHREPGLPDRQNRAIHGVAKNLPPQPHEATGGERVMQRSSQGRTRSDLIDHVFHYGAIGDYPVTGDWNGDGISSVGVFYKGQWHLDLDGDGHFTDQDIEAQFGGPHDIPLVGDFNGDGVDEIAVYRGSQLIIDSNRNYRIDKGDQILSGPAGRAVVGDWNADGVDEVAVVGRALRFVESEDAVDGGR